MHEAEQFIEGSVCTNYRRRSREAGDPRLGSLGIFALGYKWLRVRSEALVTSTHFCVVACEAAEANNEDYTDCQKEANAAIDWTAVERVGGAR